MRIENLWGLRAGLGAVEAGLGGLAVVGILLEADVVAIALLRGEEGGATAAEGVEDDLPGLGGEFDQAGHEFEWLLGGV